MYLVPTSQNSPLNAALPKYSKLRHNQIQPEILHFHFLTLYSTSSLLSPAGREDMVLYCIVLYCIVLYCIVLYCIVLYCIVLYCIVYNVFHKFQNARQVRTGRNVVKSSSPNLPSTLHILPCPRTHASS